jgi:hypothetical protein
MENKAGMIFAFYMYVKSKNTTDLGGCIMIPILITSFLVACFCFCFIVYCALANKKPTPSPGQCDDAISSPGDTYQSSKSPYNREVDPFTCPMYLGTMR